MRSIQTTLKYPFILLLALYPFTSYADGAEEKIFKEWYQSNNPGVSAVQLQQYNDLCGSCHFAYQPGLLPAVSWEKVISELDNHFGEKLMLSSVERRTMARFLLDNSAGHLNYEISHKILQSFSYDSIVKRITQTPYFIEKHSQFDSSVTSKSAGQCDQCHQDAMSGKY